MSLPLINIPDADDMPVQCDRDGRIILVADRAALIALLRLLTELPADRWPSESIIEKGSPPIGRALEAAPATDG